MKQCERCLKLTDGIHTCTPTDYARGLETKLKRLITEIDDWLTNGWDRAIQGNHEYPTLPEILAKYK